MADITKCKGTDCPLKETCYRFLAMEGLRQSYFIDVPFKDGKCKKYWKRIPIAQYDLNYNLIKEWSSCKEASKHYKISSGALNQALKGKVKISKNSIWKYLNYQNPWGLQKI